MVEVMVDEKRLVMELDAGTTVSLVSERTFKGAVDLKHQFLLHFCFVCCAHLYVCRLCINF